LGGVQQVAGEADGADDLKRLAVRDGEEFVGDRAAGGLGEVGQAFARGPACRVPCATTMNSSPPQRTRLTGVRRIGRMKRSFWATGNGWLSLADTSPPRRRALLAHRITAHFTAFNCRF